MLATVYIWRSVDTLPESVLSFHQVGLHLMSHDPSLFGGISDNQFLEMYREGLRIRTWKGRRHHPWPLKHSENKRK